MAQKQAGILEEALKYNPGSEALLGAFACQVAPELVRVCQKRIQQSQIMHLAQFWSYTFVFHFLLPVSVLTSSTSDRTGIVSVIMSVEPVVAVEAYSSFVPRLL